MSTIRISDFSGGLNLRDSPIELSSKETPDALNWTLDQHGAIKLRPGWSNVNALPGVSGKAAYIYYSPAFDLWLLVRETAGAPNSLHLYTHGSDLATGVWTDRGLLTTQLDVVPAFLDWPGTTQYVVITGAALASRTSGGTWTWNTPTLTNVSSTVFGSAIALWQNRVWIAGYPLNGAGGNQSRLFASKIGDPTVWAAPDLTTVDFREKDAEQLMALGVVSGALQVFKQASTYRLNDSSSGAYTTIDPSSGSMGPLSLVSRQGHFYSWGLDGLYAWDGIGPGKNVGDKDRPLFVTDTGVHQVPQGGFPASSPLTCGGLLEDRVLFAYPGSPGDNSNLLEYDTTHGWLMTHKLASVSADSVTSFARKGAILYAALKDANAIFRVGGAAFPGADDGTLFESNNFRTAWVEPHSGKLCRITRATIEGLLLFGQTNTLKFRVYKDGDHSTYDEYDVSSDLRQGSGSDQIQSAVVNSLGHARSFAFEFVAGTAAGDASVFSLTLDWIPLER